jgi:hypothetical protein
MVVALAFVSVTANLSGLPSLAVMSPMCSAGLTVMVAVTTLPPRSPTALLVEAWTLNEPMPAKLALGVNFKPAVAWAKVMKAPLVIGVVPSFRKSAPLVMLVIWKWVTSLPSVALRLMTKPLVV